MSHFNVENLQKASEILRALAHPLRLSIIEFIHKNDVINVNKIYNTLRLEQSITSQHLRILRQVDLVSTRREGKYIYYSLNYDRIAYVNDKVFQFLNKEEGEVKTKKVK